MALIIKLTQKSTKHMIIHLGGSLDTVTASQLDKKVDEVLSGSPAHLTFDMENLEYMSSAGVRVILKASKGLEKNKGKTTFVNLQPQIKKVFEIIRAMPDMSIFSSIAELDDYLDSMQKRVLGHED
ncbi:anti-anti-sigma factor [Desulfatibacillum alkenivorans DSM 16219]|jgi:anti-anti-sigma factor|uniref:Anti-sigma factor antagonist n=1 Tax=Desulfatibacillum alkenivorans DSM 16219 TaxID=1121393 RepID=A0A1M6HMB0_9BACT|nr:STAS domain-containing protein [Desulfatibacillum alkenivorans]SHJ23289.1 anti-anti-sigma factor [Desulfatibacillum alkenivorans DSM 16219]